MDKNDKEKLTSILLELISIPSLSGSEDKEIEYLKKLLKEMNIHFYEKDGNLYVIKGNPEFIIATHLDTVPSWGWKDAFKPYIKEGKVWGRGAVDTKGQIASVLLALEKGNDFFVVFFRDEEEGGSGSREFSIPDKLNIKGAIVLEPTLLKICTCQAGSVELEVIAKGKSAHGSIPKKGENAIEKILRLYKEIKNIFTPHPLFPFSDINLAYIEGGIDTQIIPCSCRAKIDIPVFPGKNTDVLLSQLKDLLDPDDFEYKVLEKSEPWEISQNEWIVKTLKDAYKDALGKNPSFSGMPAWTDASNLMEKGIPSVVFGAGELSCAHTSYENISIDEVYKLFLILCNLIRV